MTFQCVLVIQSSLSLYPKLIDTKKHSFDKIDNCPKKCTAYELVRRYSLILCKALSYMGQGASVDPFLVKACQLCVLISL